MANLTNAAQVNALYQKVTTLGQNVAGDMLLSERSSDGTAQKITLSALATWLAKRFGPSVGVNGNWQIYGQDTGVAAYDVPDVQMQAVNGVIQLSVDGGQTWTGVLDVGALMLTLSNSIEGRLTALESAVAADEIITDITNI